MGTMKECHHCKNPVDVTGKVGRTETCPFCDSDLHCCLNCEFYDPGVYNDCRETQAERVLNKDSSNFCDYFSFGDEPDSKYASGETGKKSRNPLDNLFKK
jgi:hypothetical protein